MKKFLAGLGWLILFAAAGMAVMGGLSVALLHHHIPFRTLLRMASSGALPGILGWVIAACFAALPGARPAPPRRFGLAQAVWGMAGTLVLMLCGATLPYLAAIYLALVRILLHLPAAMPGRHDIMLLVTSLMASELLGGLWLIWYVRRQGAVVAQGGPGGIAWRAAPSRAYGMALLGALAVLALAGAEFRLLPPDLSRLHDLPLAQLFQGPPVIALTAALVVIGLAPVLEEVLFRGLAFAGIAQRLGTGWAVVLTTLVFTALHAPEKLYYLPGFADVAAVALLSCALRLRYRSIRPGIAMHFLYNLGMLLVPALTGGK